MCMSTIRLVVCTVRVVFWYVLEKPRLGFASSSTSPRSKEFLRADTVLPQLPCLLSLRLVEHCEHSPSWRIARWVSSWPDSRLRLSGVRCRCVLSSSSSLISIVSKRTFPPSALSSPREHQALAILINNSAPLRSSFSDVLKTTVVSV